MTMVFIIIIFLLILFLWPYDIDGFTRACRYCKQDTNSEDKPLCRSCDNKRKEILKKEIGRK